MKSTRLLALVGATYLSLVCGTAVTADVGSRGDDSSFQADLSPEWQAMNQPVEPFKIADDLYYVGASSVTAFLITTPEGHILIDGGFEETVPIITSGIERLGFKLEDVEILLNSHAHIDHAGGLAKLKELTGARVMASVADAPQLERGGAGDDLLGERARFPAVEVDRKLEHGDTVSLGGKSLTALVTPGHTRGCTSWSFNVEHGGETYRAVSICSLSVLDGMRFVGDETYPGIANDFRRSFEILEDSKAEIFLASHAEFFDLKRKRYLINEDGANPFVDPQGFLAYVRTARERFEAALAEQAVSQVDP